MIEISVGILGFTQDGLTSDISIIVSHPPHCPFFVSGVLWATKEVLCDAHINKYTYLFNVHNCSPRKS